MRWSVLLIPLLVAILSGCAMNKVAAYKVDPVHEYTLTDEIDYIKPKARVY